MIQVGDKQFELFISNKEINKRIIELADEMNLQFDSIELDLLVIMNGAKQFADALCPLLLHCNYRMHFIQLKTYKGMQSSHSMNIDLNALKALKGRTVMILEDIVDSGNTCHSTINALNELNVKKSYLASLLIKPGHLKFPIMPDFKGFEIGPEFVIGFGMDYNELGREFEDIYRCID